MESYRIENLSFAYPQSAKLVLDGLNFTVEQGDFVVIAGPSGSGKTSLLRQLKTCLRPVGRRSGQICYQGQPLGEISEARQAAEIGFVMQRPDRQIVTDKVWHELAFGLENLGLDSEIIRLRVAEMATFFGISNWFYRETSLLSGGQKQILNLASIMVMQPSVLILDEPTSQLDPIAASEFINILGRIHQELGTTIIVTDHYLDEILPLADRLILLEEGRIFANARTRDLGEKLLAEGHKFSKFLPTPLQVYARIDNNYDLPLTVREGRLWLDSYASDYTLGQVPNRTRDISKLEKEEAIIELDEVFFRYHREGDDILKGLSFKIFPGEFYGLVGANGAGKSTALALIGGLIRAQRGKVKIKGKDGDKARRGQKKEQDRGVTMAILPQDHQSLFLKASVLEDLQEVLDNRKESTQRPLDCQSGDGKCKIKRRSLGEIISLCRLEGLLGQHPYDLSGGEQARLALAKILLVEPDVLLLDEPTKGLDVEFKDVLGEILADLQRDGVTIIMVSHDLDFLAQHAQWIGMIFDGALASQADSQTFFAQNSFYTTAANRMARHKLPMAVTVDDIVAACRGNCIDNEASGVDNSAREDLRDYGSSDSFLGGRFGDESNDESDSRFIIEIVEEIKSVEASSLEKSETSEIINKESKQNLFVREAKINKNLLSKSLTLLILLIVMPLTIYLGLYYFDDRKYLIVSLLLIMEAMIPMFFFFERRRPRARELVVLAVMAAIAVVGRAAFFMLPNFKPVVAIIIITGIALGAEAGFIVGVLTAFASNMFFGQGPWTPWQMLALGLIGFIAGLIFHRQGQASPLARYRLPVLIFGGLVTIVVYGGIMNPASVIIYQPEPTIEMFVLAYASGLPFDLIHAIATVFFLYILAPGFLSKLERIKDKYGLIKG